MMDASIEQNSKRRLFNNADEDDEIDLPNRRTSRALNQIRSCADHVLFRSSVPDNSNVSLPSARSRPSPSLRSSSSAILSPFPLYPSSMTSVPVENNAFVDPSCFYSVSSLMDNQVSSFSYALFDEESKSEEENPLEYGSIVESNVPACSFSKEIEKEYNEKDLKSVPEKHRVVFTSHPTATIERISTASTRSEESENSEGAEAIVPPSLRHNQRGITNPGAFRIRVSSQNTNVVRRIADDSSATIDSEVESVESMQFSPVPAHVGYDHPYRDEGHDILVEASLVNDDSLPRHYDYEMPSRGRIIHNTSTIHGDIISNDETLNYAKSMFNLVEATPVRNRTAYCTAIVILLAFLGLVTGAAAGLKFKSIPSQAQTVLSPFRSTTPPTAFSQKIPFVANAVPTSPPNLAPILAPAPAPSLAPISHATTAVPDTADTAIFQQEHNQLAFEDILPERLRHGIQEEDPISSQSKAYHWLQNDPQYETYTYSRKLQRFILAVAYYSLNGEYWTKSRKWLSYAHHECDWYSDELTGPICDGGEYAVLYLYSANVTGTIPYELSLLTSLVKIDFSHNKLKGSIPSELSKLTNLRELDLYGNSLTGRIPFQLYQGTGALVHRSGSIPSESNSLSHLRSASFGKNQLSGSLPTHFFSDWKSLNYLNLENNHFTGTLSSEIGLLNNNIAVPTFLDVHGNSFESTLPTELGQLSTVTHLYLNENKFSGTIPTEMGQLTSVKHMYLEENRFIGTIPSELGLLTNLEVLWIHGNLMSGTVPDELCTLLNKGSLKDLSIDCFYVECFCGCSCQYIIGDR